MLHHIVSLSGEYWSAYRKIPVSDILRTIEQLLQMANRWVVLNYVSDKATSVVVHATDLHYSHEICFIILQISK